MEQVRKPFQGVLNIVRFNWHFYVIALLVVMVLFFAAVNFSIPYGFFMYTLGALVLISTIVSLLASLYVYDLSGFYHLRWIDSNGEERLIVNINAGFDETSHLLQNKFVNAKLLSLDFYDEKKHTEISIKRARKAYPPFPGTSPMKTSDTNLADNMADKIFVILAAHEIRNEKEREAFFKELYRIIKPGGKIYITEHLRDLPNFLAYNFGFFHFYPREKWLSSFSQVDLRILEEKKITPFISTFILCKDGNTF
jgi:SAM-dependent methyltransferase